MCPQGSPWIPLRSIQPTISGCVLVGGSTTFYQCGSAWIKPVFGANGVYYKVVPAPSGPGESPGRLPTGVQCDDPMQSGPRIP